MPQTPFTFAQPEWLGEVSSTSDLLKERIAAGDDVRSGTVIAARRQTRGRGRMGNTWQSSPDGDLTFSLHIQPDRQDADLGALPMACALGVRDFLAMPPRRVRTLCKWPNDVMAGDAKICGILTEGGLSPAGRFGLVIGIGVNLRVVPGRDAGVGRPTAALETFSQDIPPPEKLLPELLARLEHRINRWLDSGFAALRDDLRACLWGVGREVTAKTPKGKTTGVVAGLGDNGELLLSDAAGTLTAVASVTAIESGWDALPL